LWMAFRGLKRAGRASTTVGVEWEFLKGLLWRRWACEREQYVQLLHEVLADTIHVQPGPESWQVEHVRQKVAPLWLRGSNDFPRRINLLIPTIDLSYFFGTYITVFNLALRLAEDGWKVRVITVDPCDPLTPEWKERVREFQGLREFFDRVELIHAFGQTAPIDVNLDDTFIATTWWTAHVAHRAMTDMGKSEFLYMIQEYDPCVYPTGTWSALARQTYTFPHYGLFSTEILRDYFRQNAI
ncbi:MAG: hypothetical protein ACR2OU_04190, partial [Thermomicrobiales bacterium]